MNSLADGLPPQIARQVHPDWRKNEAAYWERIRAGLRASPINQVMVERCLVGWQEVEYEVMRDADGSFTMVTDPLDLRALLRELDA